MNSFVIEGGKKLHGEVEIQGSKNSVLPILTATLLNKGVTILHYCPRISDVENMLKILEELGCVYSWIDDSLMIDTTDIHTYIVDSIYVSKMRSSIIMLGALLGRMGQIEIAFPGGCTIGERPIDLHIDALRKMNIDIKEENTFDKVLRCKTNKIKGTEIHLPIASVGATENIMLAATLSDGMTIITNPAKEPELLELQRFLNSMGAKVMGAGTNKIVIEGVKVLHDTQYNVVSDRIVAGTYMMAVTGTGGEILLKRTRANELLAVIDVITKMGAIVKDMRDGLHIKMDKRPQSIHYIETEVYPGFPTDLQSQLMAVLCIASGKSMVQEEIFEERFKIVTELAKMGANIMINNRTAIIEGVELLYGSKVITQDLRGGAGLVIAGLMAEGCTVIENIEYINRGYESIVRDITLLGGTMRAE